MGRYLSSLALNKIVEQVKENARLTEEEIKEAILAVHPVGSYYWSSDPTSPKELFGGEWTQVTGNYYMYATSNTSTGGSSSVTLTSSHMPSHGHTISSSHYHSVGSHTHSYGTHTHTMSSTSHSHTLSHSHIIQSLRTSFPRTALANGATSSVYIKVYNLINYTDTSGTSNATITMPNNTTPTSTDSKTFSTNSGSDGNGTTGRASGNIYSQTPSGSNYTLNLTPPYINAYCWYRTG